MAGNLIELKAASYRYPTGKQAIAEVDLALPEGKKIALMGANGAGKSTLLLLLNGIYKPTKGELHYRGKQYRYNRKALRELRQKVGIVFQESDNQLVAPSVYEEVAFGLSNLYSDKKWIREQVEKYLDYFDLQELKNHSPHQLSSGQKKRVCLASVLSMEPELIVCDEPASNLDPQNARLTFELLEAQNKQGKTLLISTHDVNQAYAWADLVVLLKEGSVLSVGSPIEVFGDADTLAEAGLEQPLLVKLARMHQPHLAAEELPGNEAELVNRLTKKLCTDL
ncbi:energy-coupling factor ABC transporter ATP-binding protein [Mangrovibacterium marinum]|uniref:Cobalt transport protein ATP-binding subunit n=1 Tax=Mangrovibacterium marinum TaxID=1639118 RepID=A0A2T5C3E8_9BACT|nr:ABC transporter ATP-binding protein [Mangrovibacterium marinum]PTN09273.1 cobalt transport protein ATP-binding subunit [Mangrovibacterium marinum]